VKGHQDKAQIQECLTARLNNEDDKLAKECVNANLSHSRNVVCTAAQIQSVPAIDDKNNTNELEQEQQLTNRCHRQLAAELEKSGRSSQHWKPILSSSLPAKSVQKENEKIQESESNKLTWTYTSRSHYKTSEAPAEMEGAPVLLNKGLLHFSGIAEALHAAYDKKLYKTYYQK